MWINIFNLCKLCISFWERVYCLFKVNVGFPPSPFVSLYLPPFFFLSSATIFISGAARRSDPSGRFLQHFNQALKITVFSFIHAGSAVMQPLWAARREVNPLSQQQPHEPPSDSSMPESEQTSLIHHTFTLSSSFTGTNLHRNVSETIVHVCFTPSAFLDYQGGESKILKLKYPSSLFYWAHAANVWSWSGHYFKAARV